jgi:hypothetical protein
VRPFALPPARALALAGVLAVAFAGCAASRAGSAASGGPRGSGPGSGAPAQAAGLALRVPAAARLDEPVPYPAELATGERLVIEVEGAVSAGGRDPAGAGIDPGALIASFAGGPAFLVGTGRLLWTAPAAGQLVFAVEPDPSRRLSGDYRLRVLPIGPRGDPRQREFPPPRIAFLPRTAGGPLLALRYEDRAGFGLDLKTLQLILDAEGGERVVLTPYVTTDPAGAVLRELPPDVRIPPGVHRVRATIGDALGNVAPPAEVFLDRP